MITVSIQRKHECMKELTRTSSEGINIKYRKKVTPQSNREEAKAWFDVPERTCSSNLELITS